MRTLTALQLRALSRTLLEFCAQTIDHRAFVWCAVVFVKQEISTHSPIHAPKELNHRYSHKQHTSVHRNDVFRGHFSPHSNTRKNFSRKIWTSLMSSYRRLVKNVVFFSYLLHQNDVICHQCSVTNVHNILTQVSTVHMELDYTLLILCTTSKTRTRTRTLPKWRADSYTRSHDSAVDGHA